MLCYARVRARGALIRMGLRARTMRLAGTPGRNKATRSPRATYGARRRTYAASAAGAWDVHAAPAVRKQAAARPAPRRSSRRRPSSRGVGSRAGAS